MKRPDWLIEEPAEVYHDKARNFIASHTLADFRKCPYLFWKKHSGLIPDQDRPAYAFGRAAHTLILEGRAAFAAQYATGGPVNPKTGRPFGAATKTFAEWANAQGKPVVTQEDVIALELLRNAVWTHQANGAAFIAQRQAVTDQLIAELEAYIG